MLLPRFKETEVIVGRAIPGRKRGNHRNVVRLDEIVATEYAHLGFRDLPELMALQIAIFC